MRTGLLAIAAACLATACLAQPPGTAVVPLKWVEAGVVAAMFGGQEPPAPQQLMQYRQEWVTGLGSRLARSLPPDPANVSSHWRYAAHSQVVPTERVYEGDATSAARLLPEGLDGPPIVVPGQNALLVKGTMGAIDEFRELVSMLDVKPRMVNIEVKLEDAPSTVADEWGIEFGVRSGDLIIASRGNAPASGLQARYRRQGAELSAGWDKSRSVGHVLTAANITTTNNFPAAISFGRIVPFVNSSSSYDRFGNRVVDTWVDAVFIGTELFVQPRINSNDTVTMILRPTFIEAAGTVIGPNGVNLPITQTVGTQTKVTVRDGECVQIGGFERSLREYNTRFRGLLRGVSSRASSHPRLFVTPRIIRDLAGFEGS